MSAVKKTHFLFTPQSESSINERQPTVDLCFVGVMFNLKGLKISFAMILLMIALLIVSCNRFRYSEKYIYDAVAQEDVGKNLMSRSIYLERIDHLNKMCSRYNYSGLNDMPNILNNRDLLDHIVVDSKHQLLYCYVPKVACTNWKRVFMILTGAANTTNVLSIPANLAHSRPVFLTLSNYTYENIEYFLNTYTKFLFVRHPFERLLSAFRNKLEQNYIRSKYFQSRVGRYIVKRYRTKPNNSSLVNGNDVTFDEFTAYLAKSESQDFNEHWKPINNLCEPCRIKYHFIGKYETLLSDSNYILRNVGISSIRFPHNVKTATTYKELKKYFSSLSPSRIKELYNLYELDFKLFSYNLQELLAYEVA